MKKELGSSNEQGLKVQAIASSLTGEFHASDKKNSNLSQEEGSISTLLLEHFDIHR